MGMPGYQRAELNPAGAAAVRLVSHDPAKRMNDAWLPTVFSRLFLFLAATQDETETMVSQRECAVNQAYPAHSKSFFFPIMRAYRLYRSTVCMHCTWPEPSVWFIQTRLLLYFSFHGPALQRDPKNLAFCHDTKNRYSVLMYQGPAWTASCRNAVLIYH